MLSYDAIVCRFHRVCQFGKIITGMKRSFIVSVLCVLSLVFPVFVTHASSDKAFTTVRLNKFGSVAIILGNKFGFDISSFIIPLVAGQEKEIQTPDFFPGADFKGSISKYNVPQSKVDLGKFMPWTEDNSITLTSLYGAILKTDAEHSNHPEPTDCFISEDLETSKPLDWAPTHFWNGQFLNGMFGIRPVEPNDGNGGVNFNRPNVELAGMNPAEDCKKHDLGLELRPLEVSTPKLSHFGAGTNIFGEEMTTIMKIITKIIDGVTTEVEVPETEPHKDDVILTKDQKQPWFNFMCNDYWCPGNETSDDSSDTAKTGGWTNFLLPPKDQEKVLAASLQPHDVEVLGFPQKPLLTSFDAFNQSQVGMKKAGCYSTPYTPENNPQDEAALGGLEKIQDQCMVPLPMSCEEKWFTDLKVDRPPTSTGTSGDPGYTIPYRNPSCTISTANRDMYLKVAQWFCESGACDYGKMSTELTDEVIGQMNEYGAEYKWSPLFMLALWIEESGLGSHSNASHHMGCTYGWPAQGNTAISMPQIGDPDDGMCSQMACLFSHPSNDPAGFAEFMCSYNTTAISNGSCPSGAAWTFANSIHMVYSKLLACTPAPAGCGISSDTTGNQYFCDDLQSNP